MNPNPEFVVAIPARFASTRLPGKMLAPIAGQPMIVHVAQRALAAGAREVAIATDDARIAAAVAELDVRVVMTDPGLPSGTDRLAACAASLRWSDELMVVNLQGDEPLAPPAAIRAVASTLGSSSAEIATLALPIERSDQLFDPSCVKVVCDARGQALYFSRAPIPWHRDAFTEDRTRLPASASLPWLRHIGMYAYRVRHLRAFAAMPPGRLERIEALEQLRVLEAGWHIAVAISPVAMPPGVDTAEDLEAIRELLASRA